MKSCSCEISTETRKIIIINSEQKNNLQIQYTCFKESKIFPTLLELSSESTHE